MTTEQLTDLQRAELQEDLELSFEQRIDQIDSLADIGHRYIQLTKAVSAMKQLRLGSYEGHNYRELKQLRDYIGRMFFHRRLNCYMHNFQFNGAVGVDDAGGIRGHLPVVPVGLSLKFEVEALDRRKILICTMKVGPGSSGFNHLSQTELIANLGPVDDAIHGPMTRISMHYAGNSNRRKLNCWGCGRFGCNYQRAVLLQTAVHDAYNQTGVTGVWHVLDKAWIDQASARPMTRPLTGQSIGIRCNVHKGQTVKAITPEGPHVGKLDGTIENDQGLPATVRLSYELQPGQPRHRWDIPAGEILDLLPCRPEFEAPFGLVIG